MKITKAQMALLVEVAKAGGFAADVTHNRERDAATSLRRGLTVDAGPYSLALTWAGWNALPRVWEDGAAEIAGVSASTWADYASRGKVPEPDGYAPNPATGRVARYWFPWHVERWAAVNPRIVGRALGGKQCTWREPGSTGRAGFCRRSIVAGGNRPCSAGHTDADRMAQRAS